ncbi:hypothetical protein B0T26DRAFT_751680 [Lasiosphaeria miniovina]|uniref:Uncharacterized protein n=1 Tax=Lasiosphaeria miniovina TaxID=1954250 RepID=A0AA40AKQ5_9PEZI|nr:uncharacterized protein B0T26DRAFT_751680 [Lasiosphaeria miniovina]KAK0717646.1 hypothetical protein B0T26DRAFT_751680 [Lasiosphaeria miniovina]
MGFFTIVLSLALAGVSGYCLSQSAQSIPKLHQYEAGAKKAAEWSTAAANHLLSTRRTVAVGFAVTAISLLSSLYYILFGSAGGFFAVRAALWPAFLAGAELRASAYMKSFWADKKTVPLMDDYNDAISHSANVINLCDALAVGWGGLAVLKLLGN